MDHFRVGTARNNKQNILENKTQPTYHHGKIQKKIHASYLLPKPKQDKISIIYIQRKAHHNIHWNRKTEEGQGQFWQVSIHSRHSFVFNQWLDLPPGSYINKTQN